MNKLILDACCGSKMFWFDKKNPRVLYVDKRKEEHILCDGRILKIDPDLQADFKNLPFKNNSFYLVVFDPPHLIGAGKTGWQAKKYGSLEKTWENELKKGFDECYRVLKKNGTLIFKWNEQSVKVKKIIKLINKQPLFGHRTMQNNKTIWLAFFK